MESPCECGIEPPGSISHGVSYIIYNYNIEDNIILTYLVLAKSLGVQYDKVQCGIETGGRGSSAEERKTLVFGGITNFRESRSGSFVLSTPCCWNKILAMISQINTDFICLKTGANLTQPSIVLSVLTRDLMCFCFSVFSDVWCDRKRQNLALQHDRAFESSINMELASNIHCLLVIVVSFSHQLTTYVIKLQQKMGKIIAMAS